MKIWNIEYKYIMYNIYHSSWQLSIIAKKKHLFFLATSREGWSFHPGSPTVGVFVKVNGVAKKLDAGTLKGIAWQPRKIWLLDREFMKGVFFCLILDVFGKFKL